ncbi:hypothetical protein [Paenibacillus sp. YIM B09110]|uniref:hypothetical protein n=1 Tax=Paenibacillus sp. YIM B09110 TaxID=3126102 RepID=UPI00301E41C9
MGKSVNKIPVCNDMSSPNSSWAKRQASKAVRRYALDCGQGKWYRKVYCSYNICDYRIHQTLSKAIHEWETDRHWVMVHTREALIQSWAKSFQRK